jgi:formate dehydrogenase major subunit
MSDSIRFTLDGKEIEANPEETIWQAAKRVGKEIPHLCYSAEPGYRADGNCRACMVEIEGERVLAASCLRKPTAGMKVYSSNERAKRAQRMVMELLLADQPGREAAHDRDSRFWHWADRLDLETSRFPSRETAGSDSSHPAMRVALDACINCNLCVRACREVQVNDVIGMAFRGYRQKIVFDQDDPMGASTCVACGECVQVCPTGALMPASLVDDQGRGTSARHDKEVDSVCPFCGVGCQLTYQIRENKIVAVTGRPGPSNENRLCVKGRFGFDYIDNPQRLTKPLIRREDAPKRGDLDLDPKNPLSHFREASWEEALEYAANGIKRIRERDGGHALSGFGSAKCSNEEAYLFQKVVRTGFGTNNVDHCTRLCHASSVAALLEGVGSGAVSAPFGAVEDADFVMVIGSNSTENHPVAATYFKQAAKRCTLVVMDPRGMALKRHATHMLQFKPGTDVAMLNALLNVIVSERLYDQAYIDRHTEGFENLKEHIKEFTPEAMAPICGIDAQTLRTVARKYATAKASIIFWGMGVSQHVHGTDNCRCLIALALITGQVGRPGTGLHPLRGQNNVQGASDAGLIPMMLPDYQPVVDADARKRFEDVWGTPLDPEQGLTVVETMDAIHAGKIKGMYIMGENPAMSDPNVQHAREALAKLEHLVVQDIFLTETAFHADVVLPASAWPEKDGTVTNTNRQVQRGRKAVATPGDARQDWWITNEIAQRIGCHWNYSGPSEIYAEMASVMPSLNNISWDRVSSEGAVTYPCPVPGKPGNAVIFSDGFPTASGRGKLVPASIVPPDELPDEQFPMILTTGRQLEHWHTGAMTRRAAVLDTLEPEAVATLSPGDLERIGITPGAKVRVTTRRGALELLARADSAVPSGVIFIPFCYAEAPANVLTNQALDPFGKIPEFKFCAARVEAA